MKRFNQLLVILLAFLIFACVLMRSQVEGQKQDVRALTERVEVLEKVIYDKMKQADGGEKRYSSFSL